MSDRDQTTNQMHELRYREIAELAGGLAHEIRNPLSTISLNLGVLREELSDSDNPRDRRMQQRLTTIQGECDRLQTFLNTFLQFANSAMEIQREPHDLSAYIHELIDFLKPDFAASQIEISPHLATDLPQTLIDPAQFRRALLNLTRNAQQAMPDGGTLEFQTYRSEGGVVLEIIDTGNGIPPHVQEKMFDVFYSTRPGGSGLGLPTVRKIIEAHEGSIQCASEVGKGTRFRITLPACDQQT
ncbi:sensor histidine kinase [Rubinisphaera margarita]|uniref:sensor histidine kinase n=1 Tax=Rubinisphaera margarita TaxID=2909586 RepID=UPI001EE8DFF2|nr:ATP-binding protein [Rubinisphaera margarita]MCG6158385.1 ATP-binding protein [Rubinisphaera margarita]